MSFRLSSGTLDTMAGVFGPTRKRSSVQGGGKPGGGGRGGALLGFAVASMFPKPAGILGTYRAASLTKRAFGGSTQDAVSRRAIATMDRTARRAPEVVVRITGRQHGGGHVLANFSYISRLGHGADKSLGLHTSEGEVIKDGSEMQQLAKEWHEWEMGDDARRKGATSISMILSMPTGTDPEKVKAAALGFAQAEFANRSWVASLHVDRDHPHVHLTIARRDHDGRRFHPGREDLFRYRQRFAQKLRDQGLEANATPARARGLDPAHEHIAVRKVREKGGVPRLDRTRSERLARFDAAGRADPVGGLLSEQQRTVRAAYERSIAELSASPSMVNKMVAQSLQRFLDDLPSPEPNSKKATIELRGRDASGRVAPDPSSQPGRGGDPLGDALQRLQGIRERLQAGPDHPREGDHEPGRERAERASGLSPRLRGLMAEADRQAAAAAPDATDATLRQVREADRARRERERSPDRDGPSR